MVKDLDMHFAKEENQMSEKLQKLPHHHYSAGKCKLKPRWNITTHLPEKLQFLKSVLLFLTIT